MSKYCIRLDEDGYCIATSVLAEVSFGFVEVPESLYPIGGANCGQRFDSANMCWLDEYADWYAAPTEIKPEPTPQEKIISLLERQQQSELDRDELLLDNVINDQQIILLLETGGNRV